MVKLNLGAGKKPLPRTEGWINLDKFDYPTTDEAEYQKMDLFRYPWNLSDNSVDEVFASHIIEHIPHEAKMAPPHFQAPQAEANVLLEKHARRWEELKDLDGFFAFFAEVHRVCKPDATMKIVCPFGYSRGAFQDPTHTRYIVPPTLYYLTAEENGNWDYHLPLRFKILSCDLLMEPIVAEQFKTFLQQDMDWLAAHEWDVFRDMMAVLQVIK